jgi:hypothetical protein
MGCHTWFYQRVERTFEEAKELALNEQKEIIQDWENKNSKTDETCIAYGWNELTIQETLWYHKSLLRQIENNDEFTIWQNQPESLSYYNPVTKLFYVEGVTHDIMRVRNYPDIKFFSFEEMNKWIEEHKNHDEYNTSGVTEEEINDLKEYWTKHPDSMVCFG